MKQIVNKKYERLFKNPPRYVILMGGRGAGRSTVASQFANAKLVAPEYFRCAIMRYILGDIRNSIFKEIKDRAEENGVLDSLAINDSSMVIEYGANSINAVGFKKSSGDQTSKLKSLANYNCVIIEEADEISEADFMQLDDSLRTVKGDITIILLLNPPPKTHWIITRWFDLSPSETKDFYIPAIKKDINDTLLIHTNYKDNLANLSEQTVNNYERYKQSKPAHYWNMVAGLIPETVQGKIYNNWQQIDEVPHEARLEARGLDFGWDPDPAACVDIYRWNGAYIFDEIFYQQQMRNSDIAQTIKNQPRQKLVTADAAEPKSIAEIATFGINIVPCQKGADSVAYGIGVIQGEQIFVTKRSKNLWREYSNYCYKQTKDGEQIAGEPKGGDDHCLDAARYAMTSLIPILKRKEMIDNMPRYAQKPIINPAR